jgi:hypothetical protein
MPSLTPLPNDPQPNDLYEDCVAMRLHFKRLQSAQTTDWLREFVRMAMQLRFNRSQSDLASRDKAIEEIDVSLTIRFGLGHALSIPPKFSVFPASTIYFGLRKCVLKLELEHCGIPLENVFLDQKLLTVVEVEYQQEGSKEVTLATNPSIKIAGKEGEKFKELHSWVRNTGGEKSQQWIFTSGSQNKALQGRLDQEKLGTIRIRAKPCSVKASITVSAKDVVLTLDDMGLAENRTVSLHRLRLYERLVTQRLIERISEKLISQMEWQYV